jgi:type IV pilus assembly protein PilB
LAKRSKKKIGEILLEQGSVDQATLVAAINEAKASGKRVGEVLIEQGRCDERQIAKALAEQFGVDFIDLEKPEALTKIDRSLLKEDLQRKYSVLPMKKERGALLLCVHDPLEIEAFDLIGMVSGGRADVGALATRTQITTFISGESTGPDLSKSRLVTSSMDSTVDKSMDRSQDRSMDRSIDGDANESGIVRLVERMIVEAVTGRASDIHIEPRKENVIIRYRVDGECVVIGDVPKKMQGSLLARVKLLAGVNISERRIPQDGRIKFTVDGTAIDFRVSSCPAVHGESIVLRILRPDSANTALTSLGLESDSLDQFNRIIRRPNGIFLVTGPTGSGKTTTLYAALQTLNKPGVKIITAEDPVEYQFKGINQCQVREHIGLTFNAILKSMLRQAPNVILVGEIRDREVADIAIQAALTGHLVFSTLHTNDAPSSVTRLIDMGVKPFLVASSIQAVLGQRLVRCLHSCKVHNPNPDPKFMKLVGLTQADADSGQIMGPGTCTECIGGYRGRRAIFEMMMMNQEIRDLAFARSGVSKIRAAAIRGGMRTLVGDGRLKILKGITTPEEVAKLAQVDSVDA